MTTIRDVYLKAAREVEFVADSNLIGRLARYERDFANRDEDHINFFGSNLAGVYKIRFKPEDRDNWFLNIINLDEIDLADGIKDVAYLDPKWKRPNDVMNLSCVWLMHEIHNSKHLSPSEKEEGIYLTALILMYKFLGSLLAHYFPFVTDRGTMEATIASLSMKYAIKTSGTWGNLLKTRAKEIASANTIHRRTYVRFDSDKDITYMINDIQGRLRELLKNICEVFYRVRASTDRIVTESSVLTFDGDTVVKDKSRKYTSYIRYAQTILPEKQNFIREELVSVVCDLVHTLPPKHLNEALEWMCYNFRVKGGEEVEELVEETLLHCFALISSNRAAYGQNSSIEALLGKLRALYTASRMSDPALMKMKELADSIAAKSVKSKNASILAGVRTTIQLYIVLRTLAMNHYSNSSVRVGASSIKR